MEQPEPVKQPDYTALWYFAGLSAAEIGILYVLIAVDTPVTPLVGRLMQNPGGIFTLVMVVVTLLCGGMIILLSLRERAHAKRQTMGSSSEE